MTNFNATLQQAHNEATRRAAKEAQWKAEQESREAQVLRDLRQRNTAKLEVLHEVSRWLNQDGRIAQLAVRSDGVQRVFDYLPDSDEYDDYDSDPTLYHFGIAARTGQWTSCSTYRRDDRFVWYPLDNVRSMLMLDETSLEVIAAGIAELALMHGWELPNIDMDIPDDTPPPKAEPEPQRPRRRSWWNIGGS
jgi:hypothetical protein